MPQLNRRNFTAKAAMSGLFTIVPRHVLGGPGHVAPSDKLTLAHIGMGTQSFRELGQLLATPQLQIVAVCDPNTNSSDYLDWSKGGIRNTIRKILGNPTWRENDNGCPGGREVGQEVIDTYYAKQRGAEKFKACKGYADFRELLEKEKDVDIVKIMTPDHLHATIAIAAMKKGKHVLVHKPLANRVHEARLVIETARRTKVATHFLPASPGDQVRLAAGWIRDGAIGTLREIHNWSNRPVWPQYATVPTDTPPVPKDFDWDLWLGPSLDRPYHPHYTHAVFRGWYEFGGGPVADMGHYSLWPVFREFDLDAPVLVESTPSHACTLVDNVSVTIRNDYSFPVACTIRFKFAAKKDRPALDLFWHDGGMRPPTPEDLLADGGELPREGMMFVGDQGKILAGFRGENPRILAERKAREHAAAPGGGEPPAKQRDRARGLREASWVAAFKGGAPTYGDFLLAGPISEAFNLGAVSLRLGGKRLVWDAAKMQVTNLPAANKYLVREYRKGWELTG